MADRGYRPGDTEVDHDGLRWMVAEEHPGGLLLWVCQTGETRPLGDGPEWPRASQRPAVGRLRLHDLIARAEEVSSDG